MYHQQEMWDKAIEDYTAILEKIPNDYGSLHDRALAKYNKEDYYGSLDDFDKAIESKRPDLHDDMPYGYRANTKIKLKKWEGALDDLNKAIGYYIGPASIAMDIPQFRALYPEYATASDEAIREKLRKTFYPQLRYKPGDAPFMSSPSGFVGTSFLLDSISARIDVFVALKRWRNAAADYQRLVRGAPLLVAIGLERWRVFASEPDGTQRLVDVKTFDDTNPAAIRVWLKKAQRALQH